MSNQTTLRQTSTAHNPAFPDDPGKAGWKTQAVWRIRSEYQEMPGLCLTHSQARRLLGLEARVCDAALKALLDVGYLRLTRQGYVRA